MKYYKEIISINYYLKIKNNELNAVRLYDDDYKFITISFWNKGKLGNFKRGSVYRYKINSYKPFVVDYCLKNSYIYKNYGNIAWRKYCKLLAFT